MRYLFFFVHPSKFHVFRNTINALKSKGHIVDIVITSKDVLEDLVVAEGWSYVNIFTKGRKIKGLSPYLSAFINSFITVYRLYTYTKGKKYDLFITDDLLVYIGKIKRIPSIVLTDDDLSVTKQFALVLSQATKVLAPQITNLGRYNHKKIAFPGYKELAYLHPNSFKPDINVVKTFNPEMRPYFIIRLVSLRAYHDVGIEGISDNKVLELISLLETKGVVFISAERTLPNIFEKYRLRIDPKDIAHVLYYASLFIGDSQTMTSEAAVLGTPSFRCNNFVGKISVMDEKETRYGLSNNFLPSQFDLLIEAVRKTISTDNFKEQYEKNKLQMLEDKIDLTAFMIWLFENYREIDFSKEIDFSMYKSIK